MKRSAFPLVSGDGAWFGCGAGREACTPLRRRKIYSRRRCRSSRVRLRPKALVVRLRHQGTGRRLPSEENGAAFPLVWRDVGDGDTRVIVDADMEVFPAAAAVIAPAFAIAGGAMTDLIEIAKIFYIDMDQLARPFALVRRTGSAGSSALILFSPRRRRMRLIVAARGRVGERSVRTDAPMVLARRHFPRIGRKVTEM